MTDYDHSDVNRLLRVLRHQEADRVPHLEYWVTSQAVFEHVLEKELQYDVIDASVGGQSITPEDHVEFAARLGMDAVVCNFSWRPNNVFGPASDGTEHYVGGSVKSRADLDDLDPPPALSDQLRYLERYLGAAQGTGVGVIANFTSFFDSAMLAVGVADSFLMFHDDRPLLEKLMDILLEHQEKVMQAVCARFAGDLAFVLVNDDIAHNDGLMIRPEMFLEIFPERMKRLIGPAKERGKLVAMHTDGKMDEVLPILHEVGFDAAHPIEPESNDIFRVKESWAGRMALVGNIPTPLLAYGAADEIEAQVRRYCEKLGPGGGWVLGSSTSIMEGIPPESFVAMTRAVHRYGRYGALGREP
jgi:uroporphyrinogen decarboxylase